METDTGANGYRKTNTSTFPAAASMSGYSSDSDDEPYVGLFYITKPSNQDSQAVVRNSDTNMTISWNRTASANDPYYKQILQRWDNVNNSWYTIYTNDTDYTSTGTNSYTDTTTVANRYYRYRVIAWNDAGYSDYVYTNYINTTPAAPSNVVASRSGSNVNITWNDNSYNEDQFRIQRRESTDDGETWGSWADMSPATVSAGVKLATDTSPYTYGQYRVRAEETGQSLNSSYVESNEVVTLSTPDAPTGLNPDGGVFDAMEAKTFTWNHNATDQTAQTKFSLQYKVSGGAYPGTPQINEEVTSDEFYEFAAETFTNGTVYFHQVKTWGEYATGSDWSEEAYFICLNRPVGTIIQPTNIDTYKYSQLTVEWTFTQAESEGQIAYLCKLYDNNGALLESKQVNSVVANGENDSCVFNYVLSNGETYKVTLQVEEDYGLWSEESEVTFTTEFLEPTQPVIELSLNEDSGSVDIAITNPEVVSEYEETATQDSYVYNYTGSENTNYDGEEELNLYYGGVDDLQNICLDFDLSFFVGKTIVSAQLILYRKEDFTGDMQSAVHYINDTWDETTVTYTILSAIVDLTPIGSHSHSAGDTETWDITDLLEAIADESILDYKGMCIIPTGTGYPTDVFHDKTISGSEPYVLIEISPLNTETDHNLIYRSVNGGEWELVTNEEIPINTTITDYIPNIGGNNNYKAVAISDTPSSNTSEEVDIDIEMTGMFFINGGNGFEDYVRLVGDISINESIGRDEVLKQFAGRTYPIKYQGNNKTQNLSFSADCPIEKYEDLKEIIENIGDIFYRDWRGRWFYAALLDSTFNMKDNQAYQFNTNIVRLNNNNGS
jgi:hypothetical protein